MKPNEEDEFLYEDLIGQLRLLILKGRITQNTQSNENVTNLGFKSDVQSQYHKEDFMSLWRSSKRLSIEVWLHVSNQFIEQEAMQGHSGYLLLEQWHIEMIHNSIVESGFHCTEKMLVQAINSKLYFSQLSAWLNLTKGEFPRFTYLRLCRCDHKTPLQRFFKPPEFHQFPKVLVSPSKSLQVSLHSLPRFDIFQEYPMFTWVVNYYPAETPQIHRKNYQVLGKDETMNCATMKTARKLDYLTSTKDSQLADSGSPARGVAMGYQSNIFKDAKPSVKEFSENFGKMSSNFLHLRQDLKHGDYSKKENDLLVPYGDGHTTLDESSDMGIASRHFARSNDNNDLAGGNSFVNDIGFMKSDCKRNPGASLGRLEGETNRKCLDVYVCRHCEQSKDNNLIRENCKCFEDRGLLKSDCKITYCASLGRFSEGDDRKCFDAHVCKRLETSECGKHLKATNEQTQYPDSCYCELQSKTRTSCDKLHFNELESCDIFETLDRGKQMKATNEKTDYPGSFYCELTNARTSCNKLESNDELRSCHTILHTCCSHHAKISSTNISSQSLTAKHCKKELHEPTIPNRSDLSSCTNDYKLTYCKNCSNREIHCFCDKRQDFKEELISENDTLSEFCDDERWKQTKMKTAEACGLDEKLSRVWPFVKDSEVLCGIENDFEGLLLPGMGDVFEEKCSRKMNKKLLKHSSSDRRFCAKNTEGKYMKVKEISRIKKDGVFHDQRSNLPRHVPLRYHSRHASTGTLPVFHPRTGLPMLSSPAPLRKTAGLNTVDDTHGPTCNSFDHNLSNVLSKSAPTLTTQGLLGNFEESVLNNRLLPDGVVEGFTAELSASGSTKYLAHVTLPVQAYFFKLSDDNAPSPYMGYISLDVPDVPRKGYHVPRKGTIQLTLFNPNQTVVKVFFVLYDFSDMKANFQTFLRQKITSFGKSQDLGDRIHDNLHYLIHLRFVSSKSGRIYLHTDIRLIFCRHPPDTTCLETSTSGPTDPKYVPRQNKDLKIYLVVE